MSPKYLLYITLILLGMGSLPAMSKSEGLPKDEFARRRAILIDELRALKACAILHSAPLTERNHDVNYQYRQNSDFIYLTNWIDPHGILVLTPRPEASEKAEVTFFVTPRNPGQEVWTGPRSDLETATALPLVDTSFAYDDFFNHLGEIIRGYDRLVISYGNDTGFRTDFNKRFDEVRGHPTIVQEASALLKRHRLIKSTTEINTLEQAISITDASLQDAFRIIPTLDFEYEVQAEIEYGFKKRGAERLGFPSIVGAGRNATYLHYEGHSGPLVSGDMLLLDVGAEWNFYSADISRTVPINGRFSPEQKQIYQLVLDAQLAAIAGIKPGIAFRTPHNIAVEVITAGLVKLGLLEGEPEDLIAEKAYRKFFMHGTSHWLGLDVHDAGGYTNAEGQPHILKVGMVLTVEPGIYIAELEDIDPKWWNIGVRIEDDVLVTTKGHQVLSASIPKTIRDIENLMSH